MCHNELYTGKYKGVDNYCEPYLTENQQEQLQKVRKYRKAKNNRAYLFVGLIRCPLCGRTMVSKFCQGTSKEYYYYRCPNAELNQRCSTKTLSELQAEKYVIENIKEELERFIFSHEVAKPQEKKKKSDTAKLKEQLRRVNVSYQMGNMEDDEYIAKTKELKSMIDKATREDNQVDDVDLGALKEFLNSGFEDIYDVLSKEEKQRLWRSVIDELIYDGNAIVGIKFKT